MLMTSFTPARHCSWLCPDALGVQGAPSNQIIIGLSLFLTIFIMSPIATRINSDALQPYMAKQIGTQVALDRASAPLRQFMLKQTRLSELDFFLGISGAGPTKVEDVPMRVAVPAFVVSELRTAFQMGFLVFIPFLIIDFLVASTHVDGHDDDAADHDFPPIQAPLLSWWMAGTWSFGRWLRVSEYEHRTSNRNSSITCWHVAALDWTDSRRRGAGRSDGEFIPIGHQHSEQTLSFVPKVVAVGMVIVFTAP